MRQIQRGRHHDGGGGWGSQGGRGAEQGKRKDCTRETLEGNLPLQSFPDLLAHLTPLQERTFELLGTKPHPAPPPEPLAAEPAEPSH